MRYKLGIKIFILSIILILCLLASVAFSLFVADKKFDEYIYEKEIEKIGSLTDTLARFYRDNGGWGPLYQQASDLWYSVLESGWMAANSTIEKTTPLSDYSETRFIMINQRDGQPAWDPTDLGPRICLFDKEKNFIIGLNSFNHEALVNQGCTYLPINSEEETIGWLGLINSQNPPQPLDQMFRQTQSMILFMLGGIFLLILIAMGFIYSKYILKPITRLASATQNLGRLNFNTRIPVESTDEIGELAACFNDMAVKLEQYEQNQKQWLMDISHELRTPLSVLICEIDALKDGIRKPNQTLLTSLSDEIRHLVKLVNDISEISLIETGTFTVKKKILEPYPILLHEAYIFQNRFERNDMSLRVDSDPDAARLTIFADSNRLMQLFSNIFENAIRYTQKPGWLTIRQRRQAHHLSITFEHSGPGVPDESLPLIFNRLYRMDSSRSRRSGANGLGLAICKSIVERHDGSIQARNSQGGGLIMDILIPLAEKPAEPIKRHPHREIEEPSK